LLKAIHKPHVLLERIGVRGWKAGPEANGKRCASKPVNCSEEFSPFGGRGGGQRKTIIMIAPEYF